MLFLKTCPRCRGDIYVDKDAYGHYAECLQCGFSRDLPNPAANGGERRAEEAAVAPGAERGERLKQAS